MIDYTFCTTQSYYDCLIEENVVYIQTDAVNHSYNSSTYFCCMSNSENLKSRFRITARHCSSDDDNDNEILTRRYSNPNKDKIITRLMDAREMSRIKLNVDRFLANNKENQSLILILGRTFFGNITKINKHFYID